MKIKKILIASFALLTSCVSSKYFYEHYSNISYVDKNLINIEGTYSNCPFFPDLDPDSIKEDMYSLFQLKYSSLDKLIFNPFYLYKWEEIRNTEGIINIKVISNKKLEIFYINNYGKTVYKKILNGKFVNNYFEVNTRRRIVGIPFFYFTLDIEKLNLGISKNGDLISSSSLYHFGSLLIMFGDSNHDSPIAYYRRLSANVLAN
jgi:hypothetical protein